MSFFALLSHFIITFLLLGYCILALQHLLQKWDKFECRQPIQTWLFMQIFAILLSRFTHLISTLSGFVFQNQDEARFLLPIRGNLCQKSVSAFGLFIMVPFFTTSTLLGIVVMFAYATDEQQSETCWPDDEILDSHLATIVLIFSSFISMLYIIFFAAVLTGRISFSRRRAPREMRIPLRDVLEENPCIQTKEDDPWCWTECVCGFLNFW